MGGMRVHDRSLIPRAQRAPRAASSLPWLLTLTVRAALPAALALGPARDARADAVCAAWPDGTLCRPLNPCLGSGICAAGDCHSDDLLPAGTICQASSAPCRAESTCDGQGRCVPGGLFPEGTYCGSSGSPCLGDRTCDAQGQCRPGSRLPKGTICGPVEVCRQRGVCDDAGVCVAGAPRPVGVACGETEPCRAQSRCDGAGACLPGQPQYEGSPCVGGDSCQITQCQGGVCRGIGPRDCSNGDACLKKDSCQPGVGCVPISICDLVNPPDLRPPPTDLVADLQMSLLDQAEPDQGPRRDQAPGRDLAGDSGQRDLRPQDQGSPADAPAADDGPQDAPKAPPGDGGTDAAGRAPSYYVGGACQCHIRAAAAPVSVARNASVLGLALGVLVRLLRRATRSRSAPQRPRGGAKGAPV